jgi:hypothetical protein
MTETASSGTTLCADDGVAIAAMMAAVEDPSLSVVARHQPSMERAG